LIIFSAKFESASGDYLKAKKILENARENCDTPKIWM
jgi:hypothetical protein